MYVQVYEYVNIHIKNKWKATHPWMIGWPKVSVCLEHSRFMPVSPAIISTLSLSHDCSLQFSEFYFV